MDEANTPPPVTMLVLMVVAAPTERDTRSTAEAAAAAGDSNCLLKKFFMLMLKSINFYSNLSTTRVVLGIKYTLLMYFPVMWITAVSFGVL